VIVAKIPLMQNIIEIGSSMQKLLKIKLVIFESRCSIGAREISIWRRRWFWWHLTKFSL